MRETIRALETRWSLNLSDLRGVSRLAFDATVAVTRLVEEVHETVLDVPWVRRNPLQAPIFAITRLVYGSIRGATQAVGTGLDGLLGALAPLVETPPPTAARDATVAALNGVIGDHLAASHNPLAVPMLVQSLGVCLPVDAKTLRACEPPLGSRLMLLVHGLCTGPAVWTRGGDDRAAALARALGYSPLHLQYNSGLHVSTNGRALSELLEGLLQAWPAPLEEVAIIGHSLGGLVARSALHYGAAARHAWRSTRLTMVFLGTPHHGAPLERQGHGVERILRLSGFSAPFARLGRMRSAGITDLRHGNVLDEDWDGHCRFAHAHDTRRFLPLPPDVRGFAIAGSLGGHKRSPGTRLLGDGLVPVASALGDHRDPSRRLSLPTSHQWVAHGTSHLNLVSDPAVFQRIRQWLETPSCRNAGGPPW
jgi:hypothetical protein